MGRLTRSLIRDKVQRSGYVLFGTFAELQQLGNDFSDYAGILCVDTPAAGFGNACNMVYDAPNLEYLDVGDVVQLQPNGTVRVLYRRKSRHNTILATEQCNSFCLMCSQPPKVVDDSYRVTEILQLLDLIDPASVEIGISGGEPTLLGDSFFSIVDKAKRVLPHTALHILTNGRTFKDPNFADRLGALEHHDLMLGIPLYSDLDNRHDYVVQSTGAYDETIAGFYNLTRAGVRLELRVVLHKQTIERLPQLAEFIARNLPFVEQVALMGLEMFGFTPRNLASLWIDPKDYAAELTEATRSLARSGMRVSIYNHQLCTIPRALWPFTVKSISDWKNVYLDECTGCGVRDHCGGFFQSATKRHSAHIRPLPVLSDEAHQFLQGE